MLVINVFGLSKLILFFSTRGTAFISGHADGSIVRYTISEGSTNEQQVGIHKIKFIP